MKVSRSYARSLYRWRRQAARLIVDACWLMSPTEQAYAATCRAVESGRPFNVAKVRAHCEALILEADALDDERVVFMDWARARGMGPDEPDRGRFVPGYRTFSVTADRFGGCFDLDIEAKPGHVWRIGVDPSRMRGAVITARSLRMPYANLARGHVCLTLVAVNVTRSADSGGGSVEIVDTGERPNVGGWPGKLAREYVAEQRSRRRCSRKDCHGGMLAKPLPPLTEDDAGSIMALVRQGAITASDATDIAVGACPECKQFAATRSSRAFANGGNLRRAAQRLLDTLDGRCPWNSEAEAQPSECTRCKGAGSAPRVHHLGSRTVRDGDCLPPSYIPPPQYRHLFQWRGDMWQVVDSSANPCTACTGTGHNLRGTLPPLVERTGTQHARAG